MGDTENVSEGVELHLKPTLLAFVGGVYIILSVFKKELNFIAPLAFHTSSKDSLT